MATPGSTLERVLIRAKRDLADCGMSFALVGGLAVSAQVEPRFTRDIDLVVAVTGDAQAEALVRALQLRGYAVVATVEQKATGRLATARLHPPGEGAGGVILDLLFASSGIEPEIVEAAPPTANNDRSPRRKTAPSERAGVAIRRSPMGLVASRRKVSPASTTKTSPSSQRPGGRRMAS